MNLHRKAEVFVKQRIFDYLEANPVIAAVKSDEGLESSCSCSDVKIVFTLYGDLITIPQIVRRIKDAGKIAIVHLDLITGLNGREINVDYIRQNTQADGIISTKPALIKRGRELDMFTILRIFLLDSLALENLKHQLEQVRPDVIEILPGLMPEMIARISRMVPVPVIAGGLISQKRDVMAALSAGAISISTTNPQVWEM